MQKCEQFWPCKALKPSHEWIEDSALGCCSVHSTNGLHEIIQLLTLVSTDLTNILAVPFMGANMPFVAKQHDNKRLFNESVQLHTLESGQSVLVCLVYL